MPVLTDGPHTADFILSEGPGYYSRDQITVDTGVLVPGTVLGKITATGKFVILAPAAVDGSQTAAGVLIYGCDAVAALNDARAVRCGRARICRASTRCNREARRLWRG